MFTNKLGLKIDSWVAGFIRHGHSVPMAQVVDDPMRRDGPFIRLEDFVISAVKDDLKARKAAENERHHHKAAENERHQHNLR